MGRRQPVVFLLVVRGIHDMRLFQPTRKPALISGSHTVNEEK
jgi:hypothetical protein